MLNFGKFFTLLASSFLNYSDDQRRRRQLVRQKSRGFDRFSKQNNFVHATHFLCISLPSLDDHDVKFSYAMRFGGRRHTTTNFSFAF